MNSLPTPEASKTPPPRKKNASWQGRPSVMDAPVIERPRERGTVKRALKEPHSPDFGLPWNFPRKSSGRDWGLA